MGPLDINCLNNHAKVQYLWEKINRMTEKNAKIDLEKGKISSLSKEKGAKCLWFKI